MLKNIGIAFKDRDISGSRVCGRVCQKIYGDIKSTKPKSVFSVYSWDDLASYEYVESFINFHKLAFLSFLKDFGMYEYYPMWSVLRWIGYK